MPEQLSPKKANKPRSKKIDTAIIVALIALIGTLGTALLNSPVLLAWIKNKPAPTASSVQNQLPSNSSVKIPPTSATLSSTLLPGGDAGCLVQQFADIEPTRQISVEAGAADQIYSILSEDLTKKDFIGPIGIRLTQNGKVIAALSFIFFADSHFFKITSLVDSNCQAVANYSNVDRGGDRNSLEDSDTLKIELSDGLFSLRFIFYGPDRFRFSFQKLG